MLVDGSFEEACRSLFPDLPREAVVSCEIEGGGQVQIGDMTWDTVDTEIVITAYIPGGSSDSFLRRHPDLRQHRGKVWERRFDTLPELWTALMGETA